MDCDLRNNRERHGPLYGACYGRVLHGEGDGDDRWSNRFYDGDCYGEHWHDNDHTSHSCTACHQSNAIHGEPGRQVVYIMRFDQ